MASKRVTHAFPQKKPLSHLRKRKDTIKPTEHATKKSKISPVKKEHGTIKPKAHATKKSQVSPVKKENGSTVSPASRDHDVLKKFDLTLEYGPCIGITRLERWERADKHGLNPPIDVKDIVSKHKDDSTYTESLWNDYTILK